jgi:hypothetical protein
MKYPQIKQSSTQVLRHESMPMTQSNEGNEGRRLFKLIYILDLNIPHDVVGITLL